MFFLIQSISCYCCPWWSPSGSISFVGTNFCSPCLLNPSLPQPPRSFSSTSIATSLSPSHGRHQLLPLAHVQEVWYRKPCRRQRSEVAADRLLHHLLDLLHGFQGHLEWCIQAMQLGLERSKWLEGGWIAYLKISTNFTKTSWQVD